MQDGLEKVLRGITTPTEVIHAVYTSASVESPESRAMSDALAAQEEKNVEKAAGKSGGIAPYSLRLLIYRPK